MMAKVLIGLLGAIILGGGLLLIYAAFTDPKMGGMGSAVMFGATMTFILGYGAIMEKAFIDMGKRHKRIMEKYNLHDFH